MNTNVKVIGTLVVLPANGYDGVEDHLTLEDEPDADGLLRNSVLPLVEKKASVTERIASSISRSSAIKAKLGPLINGDSFYWEKTVSRMRALFQLFRERCSSFGVHRTCRLS